MGSPFSGLPHATLPLAGTEIIPAIQGTGSGSEKHITPADLAAFVGGVTSLDGLEGPLTFTSSDDSVTITASGSTIDLKAASGSGGGGGGTTPTEPPTLVQRAVFDYDGTSETLVTLGTPATAGNLLVFYVAQVGNITAPAGLLSVCSGGGGTYSNLKTAVFQKAAVGGETTFAFTGDRGGYDPQGTSIYVEEWSGAALIGSTVNHDHQTIDDAANGMTGTLTAVEALSIVVMAYHIYTGGHDTATSGWTAYIHDTNGTGNFALYEMATTTEGDESYALSVHGVSSAQSWAMVKIKAGSTSGGSGGSGGSGSSGGSSATIKAVILAEESLNAFYEFQDVAGSTGVVDTKGGGGVGTVHGSGILLGRVGLVPDGSKSLSNQDQSNGSYITLPAAALPTSGSFSIEMLVRPRIQANNANCFIGYATSSDRFDLYWYPSNYGALGVRSGGGDHSTGVGYYGNGEKTHHIVVTWDGTTLKIYQNGEHIPSLDCGAPGYPTSDGIYIGNHVPVASNIAAPGNYQYLAFYSGEALSDDKVQTHFAATGLF